jgi:integrase
VPLGKDATDPEFWVALKRAQGDDGTLKPGTFNALIAEYRASSKWQKLRQRTQEHYSHQLERIADAWGELAVDGLTVKGIFALRAKYEATPVAANHLVSVLRTLLGWGLEHGYGSRNPANDVNALEIVDEEKAKPWPEWAYQLVLAGAPEHLQRAAFLGRATGQRRSDLVKLGRRNRVEDGLAFKIGKLRDKEHFIPLTPGQLKVIDAWSCSDTGPWIVSPTGSTMSGDHQQSSLNRYIAKTPKLQGLGLKLHGLRAMAAIDRKMLGLENKAIGKNIGMSAGMVERYTSHIDGVALARGVRDKMHAAEILQYDKKP